MKISVSLEKIACPRSRWLRGHPIFEIEYRYLREIENLAKPFLPIHMGPSQVEFFKPEQKNGRKSRLSL